MPVTLEMSNYIPPSRIKRGTEILTIKNHGLARWNNEKYRIDNFITRFTRYRIPAQVANMPGAIAQKFYGNQNYYWIICYFNGIVNPFKDLTPGKVIKIPNKTQLDNYLNLINIAQTQRQQTNSINDNNIQRV